MRPPEVSVVIPVPGEQGSLSILDRSFFSASFVVLGGSLVVNVLNYIFTLVMSRLLGAEHFGEVVALLGLLLIVSVPAATITVLMAREAAAQGVHGGHHVYRAFRSLYARSVVAAGASWIVFLAATPLISAYLHISYAPLFVFSILLPLALFSSLYTGALQGRQQFFTLSKQNILGAVIKLAVSILFVLAGFSVAGVMGALVFTAVVTFLYGFFSFHSILKASNDTPALEQESANDAAHAALHIPASAIAGMFSTTLLLTLLSTIDVLLAKHYLSPELAGQYAALSTAGKIIIYGIGAFTAVLLPMASEAHARGEGRETRVFYLSFGTAALGCVAASAVFFLMPQIVITALLGSRYLAVAEHLGLFSIAMGAVALSTVLVNFFIATRNTLFVYWLGAGVAIEIMLIALYHASVGDLAFALTLSSLILLAFMFGNYLVRYRFRTLRL